METKIIQSDFKYFENCIKTLQLSSLGEEYFSEPGSAESFLSKGFKDKEIYIVLDKNKTYIGFVYFMLNGTFYRFPFLHVIAISPVYRNKGIGTKLLDYFEKFAFEHANKIFLTVADFNPKAKQLYERQGYKTVGSIPNLYVDGVTENLMMKNKEDI